MNPSNPSDASSLSREEMTSAVFAQMVLQQANLALMLLGRIPHPQTGKTDRDIEAARAFIDQLEMLEVKTKGNLNAQEATFLKDALMSVRMAFVDAVRSSESGAQPASPPAGQAAAAPAGEQSAAPPAEPGPAAPETESRKKFAKKY